MSKCQHTTRIHIHHTVVVVVVVVVGVVVVVMIVGLHRGDNVVIGLDNNTAGMIGVESERVLLMMYMSQQEGQHPSRSMQMVHGRFSTG